MIASAAPRTSRTAAAGSRTHAARREEAESRILGNAVRMLAERGFADLTLNQVGEAAGYSRALPAHYFGTKERLVGVLAHHIVDRFNAGLRLDGEHLGMESLVAVCAAYFRHAAEDPLTLRALLIMSTEAMSNPAVAPAIVEVNDSSVRGLATSIRAGQSAGEIRKDADPNAAATLVLGQLRGVIALWLTDPDAFDLGKLQAEFVGNIRRSLAP